MQQDLLLELYREERLKLDMIEHPIIHCTEEEDAIAEEIRKTNRSRSKGLQYFGIYGKKKSNRTYSMLGSEASEPASLPVALPMVVQEIEGKTGELIRSSKAEDSSFESPRLPPLGLTPRISVSIPSREGQREGSEKGNTTSRRISFLSSAASSSPANNDESGYFPESQTSLAPSSWTSEQEYRDGVTDMKQLLELLAEARKTRTVEMVSGEDYVLTTADMLEEIFDVCERREHRHLEELKLCDPEVASVGSHATSISKESTASSARRRRSKHPGEGSKHVTSSSSLASGRGLFSSSRNMLESNVHAQDVVKRSFEKPTYRSTHRTATLPPALVHFMGHRPNNEPGFADDDDLMELEESLEEKRRRELGIPVQSDRRFNLSEFRYEKLASRRRSIMALSRQSSRRSNSSKPPEIFAAPRGGSQRRHLLDEMRYAKKEGGREMCIIFYKPERKLYEVCNVVNPLWFQDGDPSNRNWLGQNTGAENKFNCNIFDGGVKELMAQRLEWGEKNSLYEVRLTEGTGSSKVIFAVHCIPLVFSGYQDKYNTPIIEGDLLLEGKERFRVAWSQTKKLWWAYSAKGPGAILCPEDGKSRFPQYQIIGNVYDQHPKGQNDQRMTSESNPFSLDNLM